MTPAADPTPGAPAPAPLLRVEGLTRAFGGLVAVDRVSFSLAAGERVALIGPNGAGKSTLFSLICGQQKPQAGRVWLAGERVSGLPTHRLARRGVGRTFQIARAFASMPVAECLETAARLLLPPAEARDRCAALLHDLDLAALAAVPAADLSYGDIKRLDLGLALAGRPRLLLMDEPSAGMAPRDRRQMMDLVAHRTEAEGLTLLFTEHDMGVVFGHARRLLVLDRGRLIADGPPEVVRADPAVRRVYLGDAADPAAP